MLPTLLRLIGNIISSILLAPCAQLSSGLRIATMNIRTKYTAITIIQPNLHSDVPVVKGRS